MEMTTKKLLTPCEIRYGCSRGTHVYEHVELKNLVLSEFCFVMGYQIFARFANDKAKQNHCLESTNDGGSFTELGADAGADLHVSHGLCVSSNSD